VLDGVAAPLEGGVVPLSPCGEGYLCAGAWVVGMEVVWSVLVSEGVISVVLEGGCLVTMGG